MSSIAANIIADLEPLDVSIAERMYYHKGNLVEVSKDPNTTMGLMQLRQYVRANPKVRIAYHQMLAEALQDAGLHTAERILKLAELQKDAYGDQDLNIPADPRMVIDLSKEISRLISESRETSISTTTAVLVASKEDAAGILKEFLGE